MADNRLGPVRHPKIGQNGPKWTRKLRTTLIPYDFPGAAGEARKKVPGADPGPICCLPLLWEDTFGTFSGTAIFHPGGPAGPKNLQKLSFPGPGPRPEPDNLTVIENVPKIYFFPKKTLFEIKNGETSKLSSKTNSPGHHSLTTAAVKQR